MLSCLKIFESQTAPKHQSFEWHSGSYKKLHAVFCAPAVQIALVFGNGKKVMLRGFEFEKTADSVPNQSPFMLEHNLDQELISGVISKTEHHNGQLAVYFIVES